MRLKGLTNLQSLNLNNTQITDAGLVNLKGLTRLQSPWFCDTQVTRTGIAELQQATSQLQDPEARHPGCGSRAPIYCPALRSAASQPGQSTAPANQWP